MLFKETLSLSFENAFDMPQAIKCQEFWIYHYTSSEGFMNIIQNEGKAKLWFTQYDSLNDVNERKEFQEYYQSYCRRKKAEKAFSNNFVSAIASITGTDVCAVTRWTREVSVWEDGFKAPVVCGRNALCNTYLCCFSSDADSLAMWNYYSKTGCYEGYNIRFCADALDTIGGFGQGYKIDLIKVIYEDKEKETILDQKLIPLADLFEREDDDGREKIKRIVQGFVNNLQFAFKNPCFAHEKEVRAVLRVPMESKESEKCFDRQYRQKNGFIIPYIEFPLRAGIVDGVTVAPLIREEVALKNTKDFLQSRGHCIQVMPSKIPIRF